MKVRFSPFMRSLLRENGRSLRWRFPKIFIKKQTRWSNDKTIIELGYPKYRDLSVSRRSIICLSLWPRKIYNWSACHWQIAIFCWTSSNNCCKYRTWMYRGLKQCSIECKKVISWLYTFIDSFVVSGSVIGQKNSRATFSANREQI